MKKFITVIEFPVTDEQAARLETITPDNASLDLIAGEDTDITATVHFEQGDSIQLTALDTVHPGVYDSDEQKIVFADPDLLDLITEKAQRYDAIVSLIRKRPKKKGKKEKKQKKNK